MSDKWHQNVTYRNSFFTDPTISTLTSGKPSQNFDAAGLSFPRRLGVRFAPEYESRYKMFGTQAVWSAYEDKNFSRRLLNDGYVEVDGKIYDRDGELTDVRPKSDQFDHSQLIDRTGWARYYFDGKFDTSKSKKAYVKLEIRNPETELLIKTFYFELELTYKTDLDGKSYVKDPVLGNKIIKDGVLREMHKTRSGNYIYQQTMVNRKYRNIREGGSVEKIVKVPAFSQSTVKYTEKPKIVFMITPPHLMTYAKLILILIKQTFDSNVDLSYIVKESQKPLYKTKYMLDELGLIML